MENCPAWDHNTCGNTLYMVTDGDLLCKHCDYRSFIQHWRFLCYHDNDNKSEGKWIGLTTIGMLFGAMSKASMAMAKSGAPASDLAMVAAKMGERWDHTRTN